ncbi:dynamin family protein [Actinomycetes bacterium KLBMP 9759]
MTTSLMAIIEGARAAIGRYDRPDLDSRLRFAGERLVADRVRVLVVGEFKQGKSFLVNALVAAPICPVSDDIATAVPTVVHHAEGVAVTLLRSPVGDAAPERVAVPPSGIAGYVGEKGNSADRLGLLQVEVGIPRPLLEGGLEVVDTPGVGGLSSAHGAATTAALPTADAVLLVSDVSQEYSAPELAFLGQAASVCPNVACVLTKTDLYPEWRRIAEINREHLQRAGITSPVFAVSSTLRWAAVTGGDKELNAESGYPELVRYLRQDVLGQADRLTRRSVAHDVLAVVGQVESALEAELEAQRNPEGTSELVATLTAARQHATELKERSARWQQTLSDGVADLNADIDHDLRSRMREITRAAEDAITAGGDPAKTLDRFQEWVLQQVAGAASANFIWATQRARVLAERVAEHFSDDQDQMLPALRASTAHELSSVRPLAVPEQEKWGFGAKALTGLRGGYMGMLMFGMLGTLVGLSLLNPISVGAGIAMGSKTVGDERKRMISKRQSEVRVAVKRYIDDVTFQVGKDSRDRLRIVQRDLRDHFTAQAEQMKQSMQESLAGAERAVKASVEERQRRIPEIQAELARLEAVRSQARALLPPAPAEAHA